MDKYFNLDDVVLSMYESHISYDDSLVVIDNLINKLNKKALKKILKECYGVKENK